MTVPNSSFSQLSAVTRQYFLPKLYDNVFNGNPLLQRAMKNGWYKKIDGGTEVVVPLEYNDGDNAEWFQGTDTINLQDQDNFSAANYAWKQLVAPIVITRADELKNSGQSQIVDFVKAKVRNAEKTMKAKLSTGLYSAGTDSESIVGLAAFTDTASTVGGIAQGTYTWWAGKEDASTTTLTIAAMQSRFNTCSEDNEQPSVVVTTKSLYNSYYSLLQPQQRFQDSKTASGGFSSLLFNSIPVIADSSCTANAMYFLNENFLHLLVHRDEDMRMTDFVELDTQAVKIAKIFWAGVFASSNNRFQGAMTALTA